jgi:hypothetical protein
MGISVTHCLASREAESRIAAAWLVAHLKRAGVAAAECDRFGLNLVRVLASHYGWKLDPPQVVLRFDGVWSANHPAREAMVGTVVREADFAPLAGAVVWLKPGDVRWGFQGSSLTGDTRCTARPTCAPSVGAKPSGRSGG